MSDIFDIILGKQEKIKNKILLNDQNQVKKKKKILLNDQNQESKTI